MGWFSVFLAVEALEHLGTWPTPTSSCGKKHEKINQEERSTTKYENRMLYFTQGYEDASSSQELKVVF